MFAYSLFINTHPRLSVYHRMYGKEADIWQRLSYIMYIRRHWKPSIWRKMIQCRMHTIEQCWWENSEDHRDPVFYGQQMRQWKHGMQHEEPMEPPYLFDMHLNESGKADMGSSHSIMQVFPSMWDRHWRRQSVTESGILRTILVSGFMWSLFTWHRPGYTSTNGMAHRPAVPDSLFYAVAAVVFTFWFYRMH